MFDPPDPATMMLELLTALAVAVPPQGPVVPLAVANAGFEAPAITAGTFATTAPPPGWVGAGCALVKRTGRPG